MPRYLLKFGFGGVQEFIGHARKVRDVAAGSWIVSELSRAVGSEAKSAGASLVLPVIESRWSIQDHWPHQILLEVNCQDQSIQELGGALRSAAEDRWRMIIQDARLPIIKALRKENWRHWLKFERAVIHGQRALPVETFWVAVELGEGIDAYRHAYSRVARLFDHRRLTRNFAQVTAFSNQDEHRNFPCSICGVRPAVLQPPRGADEDRMCVVCLVRRFHSFPRARVRSLGSTHRLARERFFWEPNAEISRLRKSIEEKSRASGRDIAGRILDNLDDEAALKKISIPGATEQNAWEFLGDSFIEATEKLRKLAYYAIVIFDGDNMGKWLSGENFRSGCNLQEAQRNLSKTLFSFARAVRDSARKTNATIVYAGGDEGLIFCPLDSLLSVLLLIRFEWKKARMELRQSIDEILITDPTVTAHASIVHAKEPLQPVVRDLHRHIETAKNRLRGDCFSILAHPRSGSESHMLAPWDQLDHLVDMIEALGNWRRGDVRGCNPVDLRRRPGRTLAQGLVRSLLEKSDSLFLSVSPDPAEAKARRLISAEPFRRLFESESLRVLGEKKREEVRSSLDWMQERAEVSGNGFKRYPEPRRGVDHTFHLHGHEALHTAVDVALFLASELQWSTTTESEPSVKVESR